MSSSPMSSIASNERSDASVEVPLEPHESIRPSRAVEIVPRLGRERPLLEDELSPVAGSSKGERDHRLLIVGIWLLPFEGVREATRSIDLEERAPQMEQLTVGRLHRDPILPAYAHVELDVGRGEAGWTPPLRELLRLDARGEYSIGRRGQGARQVEGQPDGALRHDA